MGTLSVNGQSYQDVTRALNATDAFLTAGNFYSLPPWGDPPKMGASESDIMVINFPGVDGSWRKNLGFRGTPIYISMCTLGDDKADMWDRFDTMKQNFETFKRFTIELPNGFELEGCAMVPGGGSISDEFAVGDGNTNAPKIMLVSNWQFKQYSYSNA